MNSLIVNILEFLYNNIITVAIITTAFTLLYVTLRLSYLEVKFNRQLSFKKILFGQRRQFKYRTFSARRIVALILSVMLIALIFVRAYGSPQVIFVRNTTSLDSNQQALRIYEDFYSKFFSNPFLPILTTPQADDIPFESIQSKSYEGLDFIIETRNQVFILNLEGLQVLDFVNDRLDYFRTVSLDSPACPLEAQTPLGMMLYDNKIIIISSKSLGQCVSNPRPYVLRDNKTIVQVIDITRNFAITDTFELSGHLTDARFQGSQLLISTNQWIPFAEPNFNLGNHLPYVISNGQQEITAINEIRYVQDTSPNSFISVSLIDFSQNSIDQVSLLSDYRNQVIFRDDAVVLVMDKYEFFPVSDIFEFRNPVETLNTAVVQLNIFNNEIYFYRTQIAEGSRVESGSLFFTSDGLQVFTQSRFGRGLAHFYNPTLRYDNMTSLSFVDPIDWVRFENEYFYISLNRQQTNNYVYAYELAGNLTLVATQNDPTFGEFTRNIAPGRYLALTLFDNQRFNLSVLSQNAQLPFIQDTQLSLTLDQFSESFDVNNGTLKNIIFDPLTRNLFIPIYAFRNVDSSRSVLIYNILNPNRDPLEVEMSRIGDFQSPFIYRVIERNGRIYHFTPGGFRETLSSDPENVTRRFSFPSP